MHEEERTQGVTAPVEATGAGGGYGSREVLRQQTQRRWSALEERVVPFAELKKYLDHVKKLEEESGLFGIKNSVLAELKKKLSDKEVAYTLGELEALLKSEDLSELLSEDVSAYLAVKDTPFYVFLKSGKEPVQSSLVRSYAQSAKLLKSEELKKLEKVESLELKVEAFAQRLEGLSASLDVLKGEVEALKGALSEEGKPGLETVREELDAVLRGELEALRREAVEKVREEVEALEWRLKEFRATEKDAGLEELFLSLEERFRGLEERLERRYEGLRGELEVLAKELKELKELKTEQLKAERNEEEQSLGEALAETEPVKKRSSPLGGNALYVAITGLAGLIFLVALLVR